MFGIPASRVAPATPPSAARQDRAAVRKYRDRLRYDRLDDWERHYRSAMASAQIRHDGDQYIRLHREASRVKRQLRRLEREGR